MRFVSLKMEHFAGVVSSHVEFGPGLNVLYGPNELGKSTTAEAARAALLLQSTSAAHKPWIRWNSDDAPYVELVFQTEEQRFWRVKKTFGAASKGKAVLDESKDGVSFSLLAKGRHVDGEIRKLLKWGIPGPGSKGAPNGVPTTYLTSVLLPRQDDVTGVLNQQLSEDYDESGRQLLTGALQALATDPLFAKVLAESQGHFDRAFTTKGQKKSGKNSPWKKLSDEVAKAADRVQQSRRDEENSEDVRKTINTLRNELFEAKEHHEAENKSCTELESYLRDRDELEAKVEKAHAEFERVQKIHHDYTALLGRQEKLSAEAESFKKKLEATDKTVSTAEAGLEAAKEALRIASSDETAAQRRIQQQENEKELLKLDAEEKRVAQTQQQAERVRKLADELHSAEVEVAESKRKLVEARKVVETAEQDLAALTGLQIWHRHQDVLKRLTDAQKQLGVVQELTAKTQKLEQELAELERQLKATKVADRESIQGMQQLQGDLRVAEARLDVGLLVEVNAKQSLSVSVDSGTATAEHELQPRSTTTFESDSRLELAIDGIADIVIHGGKPTARDQHRKLSARWDKEVAPALKAAKVATLDELETARLAQDTLQRRCDDLTRDIASNQRQIEAGAAAEQTVGELQSEFDGLSSQLTKFDGDAIAKQARQLKPAAKGSSNPGEAVGALITTKRQDVETHKLNSARDEERVVALEQKIAETTADMQRAESELAEPWRSVLDGASARLLELRKQRETLDAQHKELNRARQTALSNAQKKLDTANERIANARQTKLDLERQTAEAREAFNTTSGEVRARKAEFEAIDLNTNESALKELEDQFKTLKPPIANATREDLAEMKQRLEVKRDTVARIEKSINEQEGALKVVGGDAARGRLARDTEALTQKQQDEADEELNLNGWKLLLETLRDVENAEAAHLGQALTGSIAERFGKLTSGRVGGMQLGPALETQGVMVNGETREVDRMSVGTREQLSTILRLCIAEQLESVLVLDDQLTQSDPQRMQWFRDMFRQSAKQTQIIVMTCRPEDYLQPNELNSGKPQFTSRNGLVRAIDLAQAIQR
ncbi:MAG: AAA family ATPase [Planctomycetota bacterium]|nr:AAA family ATPase [Planctomycetota bacterium]